MVRGIIFDCFGVLYGGSIETLLSLCPLERIMDMRDLNKEADYGFITNEDYINGLADILAMTPDEVVALLKQKHNRNEDLIEFVRELKRDGRYRLGLLSNVGKGTVERLFGDELHELFDVVVLSYEEHLAKPNPAVFTLTTDRLGVPAGECVMIDDLETNCEGAEVAGLQSIRHITNDGTRMALAGLLKNTVD